MVKDNFNNYCLDHLGISPFKQGFPWFGGDLQTLRDTFIDENLYLPESELCKIQITHKESRTLEKEYLIAFLNRPLDAYPPVKGLVLMLHGLGGSSRRRGLRRMTFALLASGFAVLRLNLRGAAPGRDFAAGTYAANCNNDVLPAIEKAREICKVLGTNRHSITRPIPLLGVGISLGGTILLNACLEFLSTGSAALDGLVCISSPLDLAACSSSIERLRNTVYQTWLLKRLVKQTLDDPFGVTTRERDLLNRRNGWGMPIASTIRAFDSFITAPRWNFKDVDDYYKKASPLNALLLNSFEKMPKILLIHSLDDPWVPSAAAVKLFESIQHRNLFSHVEVCLTKHGGHNGFHGPNGCWGDEVVKRWLVKLVS